MSSSLRAFVRVQKLQDETAQARRDLLHRLRREIDDPRVVEAMERVPREHFVDESQTHLAYDDAPLPIGHGQTISQPYIVGLMVSALELRRTDTVLEIGTGSGYQAAILAKLARKVVTVERVVSLAESATERLMALGYANVEVHVAGSVLGWPGDGPYNAIIVAAGAPKLPAGLMEDLAPGGRLVVPVGSKEAQELVKVTRGGGGDFSVSTLGACRFVPLVGQDAWPDLAQA